MTQIADELKQKLQEGIVTFSFRKINGDERRATGTTNMEAIPEEKRTGTTTSDPSKPQRKVSDTAQTYFDLDVNEWRSFRKDSLLTLVEFEPIEVKDMIVPDGVITVEGDPKFLESGRIQCQKFVKKAVKAVQILKPFSVKVGKHKVISCDAGDFVMQSQNGELHPCKQQYFKDNYELVEEDK